MQVFDAAATQAALPFERLIPALREAFVAGAAIPLRHRHALANESLLLMPAWRGESALGVKIVSVVPGNGARGLPAVSSTYLLCDGQTGRHLAMIDGGELTARRTAAASALAGSYLARAEADSLLIVGSGHVASCMAQAWHVVRPLARVAVWNIRPVGAERLAADLRARGMSAEAVVDLGRAVAGATVISCATLATEPLIRGAWLQAGTHLDLVGGYLPTMREADDEAIRRADIWIDTDAALAEAGDVVKPLASGVLQPGALRGSLFDLCRGVSSGRSSSDQITIFKSVGSALEDLAAASLVHGSGSSSQ